MQKIKKLLYGTISTVFTFFILFGYAHSYSDFFTPISSTCTISPSPAFSTNSTPDVCTANQLDNNSVTTNWTGNGSPTVITIDTNANYAFDRIQPNFADAGNGYPATVTVAYSTDGMSFVDATTTAVSTGAVDIITSQTEARFVRLTFSSAVTFILKDINIYSTSIINNTSLQNVVISQTNVDALTVAIGIFLFLIGFGGVQWIIMQVMPSRLG